jgi:hypothetical protein
MQVAIVGARHEHRRIEACEQIVEVLSVFHDFALLAPSRFAR